MISVSSSSVDRRAVLVLFIFYFFFLPVHSFSMTDVSSSDAANANTSASANTSSRTRTSTRTRTRTPFKGHAFDLWGAAITTDNLKPGHLQVIKRAIPTVATTLCKGNLKDVLKAIQAGTDTVFKKPSLSASPTAGDTAEYKIDREEHSADTRTYANNKTNLAQSLLGQCALPVLEQLRCMKGHDEGQFDILWVLSSLAQLTSGIRNDQFPLLQAYNAVRKVFTHTQQEQHTPTVFKDEFEQHVQAMQAVGVTITFPDTFLELEATRSPSKILTDAEKQASAFARFMALTYLNQCDASAEQTRTMLRQQFVKSVDDYPQDITVAANLVKASKPASRPRRGDRPAITLAQRAASVNHRPSTSRPDADHPCTICRSPDHWAPDCPDRLGR